MNLTQQAKRRSPAADDEPEAQGNTALVDGVRKFAMDVRDLDIDLIDRINPFDAAYAVLAKAMDEQTLKQVQATIAAKRVSISLRGGARTGACAPCSSSRSADALPDINSQDAWERRMAEGSLSSPGT